MRPVRPLVAPVAEVDGGEDLSADDVISVPRVDGSEQEEVAQDGDEEVEEALSPTPLRDPGQPTKREREEHELTHQPPRPWCDWCTKGRLHHDQHRKVVRLDPPEDEAIPTVSMDCTFMGNNRTCAADNPILVLFDNRSRALGAWQVYEKGAVPWIAKEVTSFISALGYGHSRITLKSDGEPAIVALKQAISELRTGPTVCVLRRLCVKSRRMDKWSLVSKDGKDNS